MSDSFTQLYVHLVWSTWDRRPLLTDRCRDPVYACIAEKCRELKCEPVAIGGIPDHIHLLVKLHPTVSVSKLAMEVKGASSHLVTHLLIPKSDFKWQASYGAFSIRASEVDRVKGYILNQENHHSVAVQDMEWEMKRLYADEEGGRVMREGDEEGALR